MSLHEMITDYKLVELSLPLKDATPLLVECVVQPISDSTLEATFLPDQIPMDRLDMEVPCRIGLLHEGKNLVIETSMEQTPNPVKLRMHVDRSFTYVQKREYFRVDVDVTVRYRPVYEGCKGVLRRVRGQVNLSGGGVAFPVSEDFVEGQRLYLQLELDNATVECVGELVRMFELRPGASGVALKYVQISPREQDKVVAFCFEAQRRMLKRKVETRRRG